MALSQAIIDLIRDEIGNDLDFANNDSDLGANPNALDSLENIYTTTARGGSSILRTALICWRLRLSDWQSHAFDVATEGALINRSQKTRFLKGQVARYELLVETTDTAKIEAVTIPDTPAAGSEFA